MSMIQISSGRGPVECEFAVALYLALFLERHPGTSVIKEQPGKTVHVAGRTLAAYKSVLLNVPDSQKPRTGVVKWICQSPVRPGHRRKNWFIEISPVSDADLPPQLENAAFTLAELDKGLIRVETFRSPGKGGQNVNKVETGVRVRHLPTGLTAQSVTARTQLANKKLALQRLQAAVNEHNTSREGMLAAIEWHKHDQLERGNAFAVFAGLDFEPMAGTPPTPQGS